MPNYNYLVYQEKKKFERIKRRKEIILTVLIILGILLALGWAGRIDYDYKKALLGL